MKAKNSNPELNYNLTEGKHKKTLLEKYLNQWTGEERVNGSVNLGRSDFIQNEAVHNPQEHSSQNSTNEYKEFLNNFDNFDTETDFLELDKLIKSKNHQNFSSKALSKESVSNIIKQSKFK